MTESQINPFYTVRIGSTIEASMSRMGTSIFDEKSKITILKPETDMKTSMSGESSYVYTDRMNQGSIGVAGSYGVSGVGKISSAVSAYAGNSSANSDTSVRVHCNVQLLAGVEYIDFNSLTAEGLLTAMKPGPRQRAMIALTRFNAVNALLNGADLLEVLKDEQKKKGIQSAVEAWYASVQDFFLEHGDGIVVGVMWGAMGMVTLNIENTNKESNWKYGGRANFSYSDIGTAVTVEAAYDGSQRNASTNVTIHLKDWMMGSSIAPQVKQWKDNLEKLGTDKLISAKPLESAPGLSTLTQTPSVPPFQSPAKEPSISGQFDKIKDLKGLEAFAIASAYDAAKKEPQNKDLTLDDFIRQSKEKASTAASTQLQADVAANNITVLTTQVTARTMQAAPIANAETQTQARAAAPANDDKPDPTAPFAVLGTWIANWADLFPWLATGYLNQVDDADFAKDILRKQCMIQDMLALSKLYRILESTGVKPADFNIRTSFKQIADSFSQQVHFLKEKLDNNTAVRDAFANLITEAKGIYTRWDSIKFLRGAELGLGLLHNDRSISEDILNQQVVNSFTQVTYKMEHCSFSEGGSYSPFAGFLKLLPFITPNGDIYVFGPTNMVLKGINSTGAVFSRNGKTALKMEVDMERKMLKNGDYLLYPIPFRGAASIQWKGQSLSTNIGSIKNLNQRLTEVNEELEKLNVYSFSSNNWKSDWEPDSVYRINSIKTQYVGIIDPVKSVFRP
jgi:hypothetical protein